MKNNTQKYLQNYSLSVNYLSQINAIFGKRRNNYYSHVLVIPAYNESTAFIHRLIQQAFINAQKILIITVVNQPSKPHSKITRLNRRLIQFLGSLAHLKPNTESIFFAERTHAQCDFLCVNQCEPGINPKQGVGFARKLGCDIAVELIQKGIVNAKWIHCTDADATLPENYFVAPHVQPEKFSALIYDFDHRFLTSKKSVYQVKLESANQLYQQSLHYYCKGLRQAGSTYAFTTIGSTIAISSEYYCEVRGFPMRAAGEDFYLLNKLAKLAPILELEQTIIIKPRASLRVPFGTGPALAKLLANSEFIDFDPQVFLKLQEWLTFFPKIYGKIVNPALLDEFIFEELSIETRSALTSIGVKALITHIKKQAKNSSQAERMTEGWFDGFKTLKFIHALTNNNYPKLPLKQLKTNALSAPHFKP